MTQAALAMPVLDSGQAIEFYRLFCQKNFKKYIAPDPSKTETTTHKGKEVIVLRASNGDKLAIIGTTRKGLGVLWENSLSLPANNSTRKVSQGNR